MKKTNVTKIIMVALLVLLLVVPLAGACAKPAPAPAPAPAPRASPLAQIIEGAKKEGKVFCSLATGYEKGTVTLLLAKNIKEKYGVELSISGIAAGEPGATIAQLMMEQKTGAAPTYDLVAFKDHYVVQGMEAGLFEKVDWKPLLGEGTPSGILPANPALFGSIAYSSLTYGLIYNPQKISAAEAPKSLFDLADPKWKGRLGIFGYPSSWSVQAFVRGKDRTLSFLRSIVINKPVIGTFSDIINRYLLGEIDLTLASTSHPPDIRRKGMPAEFQILDYVLVEDNRLLITKGARYPNAAKLVALYLSSGDGARFSNEQTGYASLYYSGSLLYDEVLVNAKKQGTPVYNNETYPGLLDFYGSPDIGKWQKEIELILKGG